MQKKSYGIYADGEDRDKFLNQFPINQWVWVSNLMTMPLYLGQGGNQAITPEDLLTMMEWRIRKRLRFSDLDAAQRTALEELLDGLEYRYAIYYALDRLEDESDAEKVKFSKKAFHREPSEEQVRLLNELGYEGPKPVYLSEAFLLIKRILKRGIGYC